MKDQGHLPQLYSPDFKLSTFQCVESVIWFRIFIFGSRRCRLSFVPRRGKSAVDVRNLVSWRLYLHSSRYQHRVSGFARDSVIVVACAKPKLQKLVLERKSCRSNFATQVCDQFVTREDFHEFGKTQTSMLTSYIYEV